MNSESERVKREVMELKAQLEAKEQELIARLNAQEGKERDLITRLNTAEAHIAKLEEWCEKYKKPVQSTNKAQQH